MKRDGQFIRVFSSHLYGIFSVSFQRHKKKKGKDNQGFMGQMV